MDFSTVKNSINPYIYEDLKAIIHSDLPWNQFKCRTILITGASGFIGHYLVCTLLELNDLLGLNINVIGLARNESSAQRRFGELLNRPDFKLVIQDVCEKLVIEEKADYIIHAASQASNIQFEKDPVGTINANLTGTINVLEYARKSGTQSTLFISSLKVYGEIYDGSPCMTEEMVGYLDHTNYKNCYAQGKRAAETICASYIQQYGMNIKIARPSYIYGASSLTDDRVWAQFIANVIKNENIYLKSNGAAYRSFCYVADTVSALFTILLKGDCGQPYNIADDRSNATIRELAQIAANTFKSKNLKRVFEKAEDEKEPLGDETRTPEILDNQKIRSLAWKAFYSLEDGFRQSILILETE